jgi:transcriptional regulator with XRE-family HTH domain
VLKRLKDLREARGLSQEKLAFAAGLSSGTVGNLEAGATCRMSTATKLADALGVSLSELMGEQERAAS